MPEGVRFQEDNASMPAVHPRPVSERLGGFGITVSAFQAQLLLTALASLAVIGTIYFMLSAVPPLPELGEDRLRPGEVVPANRTL